MPATEICEEARHLIKFLSLRLQLHDNSASRASFYRIGSEGNGDQ